LSANITALGVAISSGLSADNKAYDGTTGATISSNNVVLTGVLAGDAANVGLTTNGYTANFTNANVGTGIGVNVSGLGLTGSASGNYSLAAPTNLSANITPVLLTVSAVNISITYGLPASLAVNYTGFVNGEGTNVLTGVPSVTTIATTSSPPGAYPITVSSGTLSATNYVFNFLDGTLTVVGAPQLNVVALNGNQLVFSYPTLTNQNYQAQFTTNLVPATWIPLNAPVAGTGGFIIFSNTLPDFPQEFFRLLISN
jgi:hypothetical protein